MEYKRPKPVKVKNISPKVIFYGDRRYKTGAVFWLSDPAHFSKRGVMVALDEDGKEIRHLGGFRQIDGRWKSMKGEPVKPGEEVLQPTKEEQAEIEAERVYQEKLAELNKTYRAEKAPVPAEPVNKTVAEILEEKEEDSDAPKPEVLGSDEVATAVSNQNVI